MCICCPKCWKDSKVYRTSPGEEPNTVTRHRRCLDPKCDYKWVTEEKIIREVRPWNEKRPKIKPLHNAVDKNTVKE